MSILTQIFKYENAMNFTDPILECKFDEITRISLGEKLPFETEDSNFAPEPSVACALRAQNGFEFGVIYLKASMFLMVFTNVSTNRTEARLIFSSAFPELPLRQP